MEKALKGFGRKLARRSRKNKNSHIFRKLVKIFISLLIGLISISLMQVVILKFFSPPFTARMARNTISHIFKSGRYQPPVFIWRPLDKISPHLQKAVLAGEDQRFPIHNGFDLVEIRQALNEFFLENKFRGASTISMQTARTIYLLPDRGFIRKSLEAYYTVLIEMIWSKRRILEVYLNTVDWGPQIIGAEAASLKYFVKPSDQLTRRQSALLAAILPNPHRLSPVKSSSYVKTRARRILADMDRMPLM
jgi:monofunctional biosynthetic peptidoglycan transglycosylase